MTKAMIINLGRGSEKTVSQTRSASDFWHGGQRMNIRNDGITMAMQACRIHFDGSIGDLDIEPGSELNDPMGRLNWKLGSHAQLAPLHCKRWIEPGEFIQGQGTETIETFT